MKTAQKPGSGSPPSSVCPVCGSGLFYPGQRSQDCAGEWRVLMICPDCFAWRGLSVDREEMLLLLKDRQEGLEQIERQLLELERRHMRQECGKFIAALRAGHIMPEDF